MLSHILEIHTMGEVMFNDNQKIDAQVQTIQIEEPKATPKLSRNARRRRKKKRLKKERKLREKQL